MRVKDDTKFRAICDATISLVNEIGFAAASVAKIAKRAGVSPATIYIYFDNKDDLLVSTYTTIKKEMSEAMLAGIDLQAPVRDIFQQIWRQTFVYVTQHRDKFQFTEQFANSPYVDQVDSTEIDRYFAPVFAVIQRGIDQKIIKNVNFDLLSAFMFFPILTLANSRLCRSFTPTEENIDISFSLAWDAIKL
ncbi:MAG: TetR/AcrR family transcriptional regulator [Gemmatimonadetes bacterium]|nr:MAG: TetR/AcrR family transcriptional regulator [Gemmatimonadota bacterium]